MKAARRRDLLVALVAAAVIGGGVFLLGTRRAQPLRARPIERPEPRRIERDGRTEAEGRAIAEALISLPKDFPPLRLAEDADADSSDARSDLEDLYADYHPYFVRGDLDGDGRLDFAQAFVEKRAGGLWFHVAVFFGKPDGSFSKPVWVERSISLSAGDLSIDRSLLIVTPDLSVDQARRWRFEPQERRFVDADAVSRPEDPDGDAPDETPDGRPQVRA